MTIYKYTRRLPSLPNEWGNNPVFHAINYNVTCACPSSTKHQSRNKMRMTTSPPTSIESQLSRRPRLNKKLESIKEQGQRILEATILDIQSKTDRHLLVEDEDNGPTVNQLKEATRLKQLMEDAIEEYTSKRGNLFCIMSEPIVVIDCEVTEDLRQARVFWSLPFAVLMMGDGKINQATREKIVKRMQRILDERGGVLQGLVHNKLRSYFRPPRIRFVPAEGEMLRRTLLDFI